MARHTYPGTLRRRGPGHWWWRYQIAGRRYSRTFDAPDRPAAERYIRNTLLEDVEQEDARVAAGQRVEPRMSHLLATFATDYHGTRKAITPGTRRSNQDSLTYFTRFFVEQEGDPKVRDVTKGQIARYFDWRRPRRGGGDKTTVAQRTLRRDYAVLHLVFEFAVEREYRGDNPVRAVKKPPRGDEREAIVLSAEQVEKLLDACAEHPMLHLFILTCSELALRPNSEALWLRWEDVDFRQARLKVVSGRDGHRTKTGKSRVLPLSSRMLDALRAHFAAYRMNGGSPWVFHHVAADRHARAGDRINDLRRAFQSAARQAGLPAGLWPYDLRHTRITRWVSAGHNLALVQKAAGHASMRTTMIYVHLTDDDLGALVAEGTRTVDLKRQLRAG